MLAARAETALGETALAWYGSQPVSSVNEV